MKAILARVLVVVFASDLVWTQTALGQDKPSQASAHAGPTLAELEGAVVEATVVMQRVVLRDGMEFPAKFQSDLKLAFAPGDKLEGSLIATATSARGTRKGKPQMFSPKIEQPKEIELSGGGHSVWIFDKATLTNLRTFKGGAYKREITFARSGQDLTCKIEETFAREDGVGSLIMNSPIDNAPMRVVTSKQTSSTCKVTKPK